MAVSTAALVKVRGLRKHFHQKGGFAQPAATIRAVEDISFDVMRAKRWVSSGSRVAENRRQRG